MTLEPLDRRKGAPQRRCGAPPRSALVCDYAQLDPAFRKGGVHWSLPGVVGGKPGMCHVKMIGSWSTSSSVCPQRIVAVASTSKLPLFGPVVSVSYTHLTLPTTERV